VLLDDLSHDVVDAEVLPESASPHAERVGEVCDTAFDTERDALGQPRERGDQTAHEDLGEMGESAVSAFLQGDLPCPGRAVPGARLLASGRAAPPGSAR
jgi:hypothetical protein